MKHYPPTWNRGYSFEDLHEYTYFLVTIKVSDTRFRLFPMVEDVHFYLKKLRGNLVKSDCQLIEYMVMKSHVHFLIRTKAGLQPLMRVMLATNTSYAMHLRYFVKHPRKKWNGENSLIGFLRDNPNARIFQKNNNYIPITGFPHLLIEMRYIKRNPENAHLRNGDRFISSRKEYVENYFQYVHRQEIIDTAGLFAMTPIELHKALMIDDDMWKATFPSEWKIDAKGEQALFKIEHAKYPLHTFSLEEINDLHLKK